MNPRTTASNHRLVDPKGGPFGSLRRTSRFEASSSRVRAHDRPRPRLPHVGADFRTAVKRAGIAASGRLSLHSLRHGYASLLISNGLNVVFVSRQLGHANPKVTLGVYAHLYARADHADSARTALEAGHAAISDAGG